MGGVSGNDVVRALMRVGFVKAGQKGSHVKLRRDRSSVIVPMHREIAPGTLHSIARQAGMTWDEFTALFE